MNGEPGVYSARYAGEHKSSEDNIDLLLNKLLPHENRRARFRTVITLLGLAPAPLYFDGIVPGVITPGRKGTSGFGYDPIFIPMGFDITFGQLQIQNRKIEVSHRAKALEKFVQWYNNLK